MLKATTPRMNYAHLNKHAGKEVSALLVMSEAIANSGLEKELLEFVKIRASQINGCSFCLQMHTADARKIGIPEERLTLTAAWREAPFYSERERAALALTESVTLIASHHGVADEVYSEAASVFSEAELAHLMSAIVNINAWNRLAITYRFTPQVAVAKAA
jgi:AhpD family alkylhydroperoxidase